jgi:hypothetical protein
MRIRNFVLIGLLLLGGFVPLAHAASPTCTSPETKLSWPAVNPIWEMCWLRPSQSVGPDGSGMELRNIHYNGQLVARRAHAPMLFAEYKDGAGGDCYRDWKNQNTNILAATVVQNQLGVVPSGGAPAMTSCDRSNHPTTSYSTCPYGLAIGSGYSCASGVMIEDYGNHVLLTAQYIADWYMYSSRWAFYADGRIEPSFGFGNRNGTFNGVTHWHHNYWRIEFDIEGLGNNMVSTNGVDQMTEFSDLRNATGGPGGGPKTWEVRNPVTGNGYRFVPGSEDYNVPTNQSGRNFHTTDFMATKTKTNEYGDSATNDLFDCAMDKNVLTNSESIANTNVAIYYRVAVRDTTANSWPPGCSGASCLPQDSMICKKTGPHLVPIGPWADYIFANGFDILVPGARPWDTR